MARYEPCGNFLATSTFSPNASGLTHGRTSPSLSEELYDGSDVRACHRGEVSESALTAVTHETRSACFGVPAEVQNCQTVQEDCPGVLRHELANSGATVGQLITRRWRINF